MKFRPIIYFFLANILLCLWVFGDALWGKSILAPLDIAPAFFQHYRYMNPASSGIPQNHFIIDQLTYDLPIQHTIYQSLQRGEMPWWDPYTFSGRPLLADAHINGTDPFRLLLYQILPFETAYNWTLILHTVFSGLAALLFLRYLGFSEIISLSLALAVEFAGSAALSFGHPWIQASFLYYPLVWLVWDQESRRQYRGAIILNSLLIAAIFYSGNLQSHAYLFLFLLALVVGYAGASWRAWLILSSRAGLAAFLGACLAAPVLFGQLEFFLNSSRAIGVFPKTSWFSGLLSISNVFPWMLGTFRTLDAGKIVSESGLSFRLFIGSTAFLLAIIGTGLTSANPFWLKPKKTALALVLIYFIILSSPLYSYLYPRAAGLGVLGLMVLAAIGIEELLRRTRSFRQGAFAVWAFALALTVGLNLAGLWLYPRVLPKVQALVKKQASSASVLTAPAALRTFQVENWPHETTFKNPETILAVLGLIGLGFFLYAPRWRTRQTTILLLVLNLLPVALFFGRFIPRQPIQQWDRLLAGGPEQRQMASLLGNSPNRLYEMPGLINDHLFPNAMSHLYHIRTVHGYSALQPKSLILLPPETLTPYQNQIADYTFTTNDGPKKITTFPMARFQWKSALPRTFQVEDQGLNEIHLNFSPGEEGDLIWADTYYPGWTASQGEKNIPLNPEPPCFSRLHISPNPAVVVLKYRPSYLRSGEITAFCGLLILAMLRLCSWIKLRKQTSTV